MIDPLASLLAGLAAVGTAWLVACLSGLAKRKTLDTPLLDQAARQLALGRDAYVRDLVRDDPRWTSRMIARAAEDAAGKPAEILEALPEVFMADFARVRERIGRLRTIGVAGIAVGIFYAFARMKASAHEADPGAGGLGDPADLAFIGLLVMVVFLIACLPLKNQATLLALRTRQELGALLARVRGPAPAGKGDR